MLPGHKFGFTEKKVTASSGTVKTLLLNKIDKDCTAVSLLRNDAKQNTPEQRSRKRKQDSELYSELYGSPKKILLNNPTCDENNNNFNTIDSDDDPKSYIVFRNWHVFINMKGQFFIEGNIKCDIKSRSYPVAKRITNTKLQSIYKRIYILDGNMVDRYDIPDYVKMKFHNGFPEDWETVYRLWKKYFEVGHKRSFKWPPMTSTITSDEKNTNYNKADSPETKVCQFFSHWRVLLNDEGELIIEGTLECGRIERSKRIVKRLSNKKVLSVCKRIYILDGTLANERNDLPDYVRWKFHNGFPADWENVYLHWKNYLAKRFNSKKAIVTIDNDDSTVNY